MEYYSAFKKKEMLSLGTKWINPEDIMLSELSQTERETTTTWYHLHVHKLSVRR